MPTPFNRLGYQTKSAINWGSVGRLIKPTAKRLWNDGVWSTAAKGAERLAGRGGAIGGIARAVKPVAGVMSHPATQMAGWATMPLAAAGVPGMDLVNGILQPGWGAALGLPGAITSARLASGKYNDQIANDARSGADTAVEDLLTINKSDPKLLTQKGGYLPALEANGISTRGINKFLNGSGASAKPMGVMEQLGLAFSDPQKIVDRKVHDKLDQVVKSGGWAGSAFNGITKLLPILSAGGAVAGIGSALLSDKPYDADKIKTQGYDAAQAKINKNLDNMSTIERTALKWDPTLLYGAIDKASPGAVKRWAGKTGFEATPGWLEGTRRAFSGGPATYYSVDNAGNRKYLPPS